MVGVHPQNAADGVSSRLFWDASALVKAFVHEDGTPNVKSAIALRNVRGFVSEFVALELLATFGKKRRSGVITARRYRTVIPEFYRSYPTDFDVLPVDEPILSDSRALVEKHHKLAAGAMDILHLASARKAAGLCHPFPLVLVTCDQSLLDAARAEGVATYNPEAEPQAALRAALRLR